MTAADHGPYSVTGPAAEGNGFRVGRETVARIFLTS